MGSRRLTSLISLIACGFAAAGASAAQQKTKEVIATPDGSLAAYASPSPCGSIVDIELRGAREDVFSQANALMLESLMGNVTLLISLECSARQVQIKKYTFSGRASGRLVFAASAVEAIPGTGWTQPVLTKLSAVK